MSALFFIKILTNCKNMAKKYPPGYVKNPKKVAAGKARAEKGIKDSTGKYVSKTFENELARTLLANKGIDVSKVKPDQDEKIKKLLDDAGVTKKEIKQMYLNAPDFFDDLKKTLKLTGTMKDGNQVEKVIDEYKGKFLIIDTPEGTPRPVSKTEIKLELIKFKQFLSGKINVVDFGLSPILSVFEGTATYHIPNVELLLQELKSSLNVSTDKQLKKKDGTEVMEAINNILKEWGFSEYIVIYVS